MTVTAVSSIEQFITLDDANADPDAAYEMAYAVLEATTKRGAQARIDTGEVCRRLTVRWGEAVIDRAAKDIGIAARTLREYRQVVETFEYGALCHFVRERVSWDVLRMTARYYPGDGAQAVAFVDDALDKGLSRDQALSALAEANGKPPRPRIYFDMPLTLSRVDVERGVIVLSDLGDAVWTLDGMTGATVLVRVVAAAVRGAGSAAVSEAEAGR
jgi:hypothetical protein